uniref:Uncharacterized protein n=1 Tax=Anguilla anguilla TaxID=7936 RepID=A0A0E9UUV3_ANGAN
MLINTSTHLHMPIHVFTHLHTFIRT